MKDLAISLVPVPLRDQVQTLLDEPDVVGFSLYSDKKLTQVTLRRRHPDGRVTREVHKIVALPIV